MQPGSWSRVAKAMKSAWPVLVLAAGMFALVAGVVVGVATKPKPDLGSPLGRADRLIQDGEFQQALDVLNDEVLPLVGQKWVRSEDRARYHLGLARSVYLGQRALGIREPSNDETVRREYLASEDFGAQLTPEDVVRLCDVYVELGQEERALSRVMKLTGDASDQRRRILRRLVEHELAKARPEYDRAIQVLTTISGDADLSLEDRAWSLARETEIRLGQGYAAEAVARLLQGIMRIEDAPAASLAELYTLLGTGYFAMGEYDSARKQLERAATLLGNTEPMMARVQVYQAMCDQATGSTDDARDRYSAVAAWAQGMDWQVPAMFGLAETEGVLGRTEESIDAYADVVEALLAGRSHPLVQPERVADSLLHQAEDRLTAEDPRSALRFVLRVEELFSLEHVPPEVLRTLAVAHRMLADRMIADVLVPGLDSVRQIARLDPATRETVQRHFLAAGQYFSRHAAAVMLSDNEGYVQSLWSAALSYDMAGDYERAIASFREYIEGVPDDASVPGREASRAEARFRMGRAYQARGEHKLAADVFEALIADGELGSEGEGVGQYAEESYVPLAQVYLADGDGENDAEARRLLAEAVSGRLGDEGSLYFHDALFELGALHHRAGEYLAAVERLGEAARAVPGGSGGAGASVPAGGLAASGGGVDRADAGQGRDAGRAGVGDGRGARGAPAGGDRALRAGASGAGRRGSRVHAREPAGGAAELVLLPGRLRVRHGRLRRGGAALRDGAGAVQPGPRVAGGDGADRERVCGDGADRSGAGGQRACQAVLCPTARGRVERPVPADEQGGLGTMA